MNFFKNECKHTKVSAQVEEMYCPDCGKLIRNRWFLLRCKCCNVKLMAHTHFNEIVPDTKFCKNCGSSEYYIQELDSLNFIDVRFAVLKKITVKNFQKTTTNQIWVEEDKINSSSTPFFLPLLSKK